MVFEHVATSDNGWHAVKVGCRVGWVSGNYSEITTICVLKRNTV